MTPFKIVDKSISINTEYWMPIRLKGSIFNGSLNFAKVRLSCAKRKEAFVTSDEHKIPQIVFEVTFVGMILVKKEHFMLIVEDLPPAFCINHTSKTEQVSREVIHVDKAEERISGRTEFTTSTYTETVKSNIINFQIPAPDLAILLNKDEIKVHLKLEDKNYFLTLKKLRLHAFQYLIALANDLPTEIYLEELKKAENLLDTKMKATLYGGIIGSAGALLLLTIVFNNFKIKGDWDFWIGMPLLAMLVISIVIYYFLFKKKYGGFM